MKKISKIYKIYIISGTSKLIKSDYSSQTSQSDNSTFNIIIVGTISTIFYTKFNSDLETFIKFEEY